MTEFSDNEFLFTSESVTEGHPDKIADQISDGVLDAVMRDDPAGRVACETLVNTGLVLVSGEITTETYVDIPAVARETIKRIGYTDAEYGFDYHTCAVINAIDKQSPDIAQGVERAYEARTDPADDDELDVAGAGDQGMMFGYATRETEELMPLPISLAHKLARRLADVRKAGTVPYLRPDGKTQVTVRYVDGWPVEVEKLLISCQHRDGAESLLKGDLWEHVVEPVLHQTPQLYEPRKLHRQFLVNPTGRFVIGGPMGDCGLTGRKVIVDTYGGTARHGGGAFSGKDPSKVDRSAAYAARYVAKNVVAAGLADRVEVQVAYAIGVAHPVSVMVETFGTEKIGRARILELISSTSTCGPVPFATTCASIVRSFKRRPRTGTSAARITTSLGSGPTRPRLYAQPRASALPRCGPNRGQRAGKSVFETIESRRSAPPITAKKTSRPSGLRTRSESTR